MAALMRTNSDCSLMTSASGLDAFVREDLAMDPARRAANTEEVVLPEFWTCPCDMSWLRRWETGPCRAMQGVNIASCFEAELGMAQRDVSPEAQPWAAYS